MTSEATGLVTFEDPPRNPTQSGKYIPHLLEIQRNPGQWAKIVTAPGVSTYIVSWKSSYREGGAYSQIDIPGFEFTTRRCGDGSNRRDLYARYMGADAP
jgi:hypothetical protein